MDTEQTVICQRGEGRGKLMKEGEGIGQRTYPHDPWTWTTVRCWPEGRVNENCVEESKWAGGEENGDICNSVNNKNEVKINKNICHIYNKY